MKIESRLVSGTNGFQPLYVNSPKKNMTCKFRSKHQCFSRFVYSYDLRLHHFCNTHSLVATELTHSHTMTPFDAPGKEAF